ncbi:MAG: hypothetical protein HYV40_05925 [Candidatus Levybacteria bacterium]|nr:hypothetical protein [Candidatus Levybacteria bacterium]
MMSEAPLLIGIDPQRQTKSREEAYRAGREVLSRVGAGAVALVEFASSHPLWSEARAGAKLVDKPGFDPQLVFYAPSIYPTRPTGEVRLTYVEGPARVTYRDPDGNIVSAADVKFISAHGGDLFFGRSHPDIMSIRYYNPQEGWVVKKSKDGLRLSEDCDIAWRNKYDQDHEIEIRNGQARRIK